MLHQPSSPPSSNDNGKHPRPPRHDGNEAHVNTVHDNNNAKAQPSTEEQHAAQHADDAGEPMDLSPSPPPSPPPPCKRAERLSADAREIGALLRAGSSDAAWQEFRRVFRELRAQTHSSSSSSSDGSLMDILLRTLGCTPPLLPAQSRTWASDDYVWAVLSYRTVYVNCQTRSGERITFVDATALTDVVECRILAGGRGLGERHALSPDHIRSCERKGRLVRVCFDPVCIRVRHLPAKVRRQLERAERARTANASAAAEALTCYGDITLRSLAPDEEWSKSDEVALCLTDWDR